jgi:hypothetical protein
VKRRPWRAAAPRGGVVGRSGSIRAVQSSGPLRVGVDYNAELPIWGRDWQSLGLDESLLDQLADWQDEFDANYVSERGWKTVTSRDKWAREATRLEVALRSALPDMEIEFDLWPLSEN